MKKEILLSLFVSTILVAQNIELKPLQITSTAIKTDELRSSDAVEIYTDEDIEKSHTKNIYEFLNQQTSVIAMPSYGNSYAQKLDMRGYGIDSGYQNIVITLDGRKLNNIDMVAPLLGSIPITSIEKIEIIKSSGIVIGGDGANAGVINITTKKSSDKEISIYGGTQKSVGSSFYLGHSDEKLSIAASGDAQRSDGTRDTKDGGDEKKLYNASFNISYLIGDQFELRAGAISARSDQIFAGFLTLDEYNESAGQEGVISPNRQKFNTDTLSAGVSYFMNEKLSFDLDASHEKKRSNYVTYSSISDYDYDNARAIVDFKDGYLALKAGVELKNGDRDSQASSYAIASKTTKDNFSTFMMSSFNFYNHSIKAGVRSEKVEYKYSDKLNDLRDDHHLFGAEFGYNYLLNDQSSLFANYAHAYQAPDIDRFFNKDWSGRVTFNGFIDPMKSDSYTLGYNNIRTNNKLKISLFYVDLQDEIYYYSDPTYINSKNTNIDKSHKYGFDLYDKVIIDDNLDLVLNYSYVEAKIDQDSYVGKNLPGVSKHNTKATLNYTPISALTIGLTQNYRSSAYAMDDFSNSFTQKQSAYTSTDLGASYTQDSWELFAKINNLFNQKNGLWISDNVIYPTDFKITALAGLRVKF